MRAEIYQDAVGKWRWRVVAANGEAVATSGESFASRHNAQRALRIAALGFVRILTDLCVRGGV